MITCHAKYSCENKWVGLVSIGGGVHVGVFSMVDDMKGNINGKLLIKGMKFYL